MKKITLLLLLLLLDGCVYKAPLKNSNSVFVVLKTKKMRFADAGFIRHDATHINLELFNSGTPILDLDIKKDTCINKICYKKKQFNREFLGFSFYDDFLSDVLLKRAIYNGIQLQKTENGFMQRIKNDKQNITYEVNFDEIKFKDRKNNILIKIKNL